MTRTALENVAQRFSAAFAGLKACATTGAMMTATILSAQTSTGPETTVRDGVYSAEQARRGRAIYDAKCASCHDGGTMGPELWGDSFLAEWDNKTVGAFYARIQTTMPEDAPGSLSEGDVLDVVAYVLQTNGFKAGDNGIQRADALATVRFVRK
jgi:S-disulfanyl-L-cysteine oxidoreductase SoxD